MQTKLTLKVDKDTILQAKKYADKTHQSLSSLVENYFKALIRRFSNTSEKPTPIVNSLSGSIKGSRTRDIKSEYTHYLERKYKR